MNAERPVPWTRYWIPAGTDPTVDAAGFLLEPYYRSAVTSRPIRVSNVDARTYSELSGVPCLILLGEPGAGKSTELNHAAEPDAVRIDLGGIGSDWKFEQALAQNPALLEWKRTGRPLTLLIDAYDEALLRVDTAARLLRSALTDGLPTDDAERLAHVRSLRLRIASRGGVWPQSVTDALASLFGDGDVRVVTLAPLRHADASLAAATWGLRDGFMEAIREAGVGPLAALPLSLVWLATLYARDGRFPATRRAVFEAGIAMLCEESNEDRREAGRVGHLGASRRVALAGRIAAMMRFGDRAVLYLGREPVDEEGVLLARDVEGKERVPGEDSFGIDSDALRDLVDTTTLFRAAGHDAFRWTQESIADFLAVWYIDHRELETAQVLSLLTDPEDGHVVPQLIEVAAWAASVNPDVFLALAERDPNVALRGDVQALPPDVRAQGVEAYLTALHDGRLRTFTDPTPSSYRGLDHSGLEDQLRSWIGGPYDSRARTEAVLIASHNQIAGLVPTLVAHALDSHAPSELRTTSIYTLHRLADETSLARLRPIAFERTPGQGGEWLRSAARNVLWPDQFSFEDLLASLALDPPDDEDSVSGNRFFEYVSEDHTAGSVDVAACPPHLFDALDWIEAGEGTSVPGLAHSALVAAAQLVDVPDVGRRLAPLLVQMADRDDDLHALRTTEQDLQQALAKSGGDRTVFLDALVASLVAAESTRAVFSVNHAFYPARHEDVPWLVRRVLDASDETTEEVCVRLLQPLTSPSDPATLDSVAAVLREAAAHAPRIQRLVEEAYGTCSLDDAHAQEVRSRRLRQQIQPLSPTIPRRIDAALAQDSSAPAETWRAVCHTLTLNPDDGARRAHSDLHADLTTHRAWTTLDAARQDHVVAAARHFLLSTAPDESDWSCEASEWTWKVLDGVRALTLLQSASVPLPDAVRAAWAPALLLRMESGLVERADAHRALVVQAARADPPAFRAHVVRVLASPHANPAMLSRAIEPLNDPDLDLAFLAAVDAGRIDGSDLHEVLRGLLLRRTPGADAVAVRLVRDGRDALPTASWVLLHLQTHPSAAWDAYGDQVLEDDAFARALLERAAVRFGPTPLPVETPVAALVALERRLHALYPPADDPPRPKGTYSPSTQDQLRDLRGGFAAVLAAQGTDASVEAVASLADVLSVETLRYQLKLARTRRREVARQPLHPTSFVALAERAEARLVRSDRELFDVTVEALRGFEAWLRTEDAPRVHDLWNAVPRAEALRIAAAVARSSGGEDALAEQLDALRRSSTKNPTFAFPKDEATLADLALRFLQERLGPRGVVVAREAQVERGHATDLYVSAKPTGSAPASTVVIEVKGSWHPDLYTALPDQLATGYLNGVSRRYGIYLVGWYGDRGWYSPAPGVSHPKANKARRGGPVRLTRRLDDVAQASTTSDRHVTAVVVDASLPLPRASA